MIIRAYALGWAVFYMAVYFAFRDFFPAKVMIDALYIQGITETASIDEATLGFALIGTLLTVIPFAFQLVGLSNAAVLFALARMTRTYQGMAILTLLLLPMVYMVMPAPLKDTLVVAASTLLMLYAMRGPPPKRFLGVVIVGYLMFGLGLRDYYLLVLLVFIGLLLFSRTPGQLKLLYVLPIILVLLFLPASVFEAVGGARDMVNEIYVYGLPEEDVRTFFVNPFPSDNGLHFVGNYIYAFVILNIPFTRDVTFKEIVLFVNIALCSGLMIYALRRFGHDDVRRYLAFLFLSQLLVFWIFEPDSGSYLRHVLTFVPFLMPTFLALDEQLAARMTKIFKGPERQPPREG